VASLTLLIIQLNENERTLGRWKYLLVVVLLFLSWMMVSTVRYPSFKALGLRSTSTFLKAILAALFLGLILVLREKILTMCCPRSSHSTSSTDSSGRASRAGSGTKSRRKRRRTASPGRLRATERNA
jgi:phosphatidylserine synthase